MTIKINYLSYDYADVTALSSNAPEFIVTSTVCTYEVYWTTTLCMKGEYETDGEVGKAEMIELISKKIKHATDPDTSNS